MVTGPISFIASMMMVIHILRSHECLSSTYHRLIFGLSAADIISSFGVALSSTMKPKEMSYLVPFASGNIATCTAQGFLVYFAVAVSMAYNCSVCFYYLAIISYNKNDDYIRRKLEPWFHGISILFPLVLSVIFLATNSFNGPDGGVCFPQPYYPPHCVGFGAGDTPEEYSIPCGRGGPYDGHAKLRTITMYAGLLFVLIIAPVTILASMASMFRSVTKIEKQMLKYGVNALRFRATLAAPATNTNPAHQEEARGFTLKMKELGECLCLTADASKNNHRFAICCLRCPHAGDDRDPNRLTRSTKHNKMTTKKRAVLHMAFGYAGAWLVVGLPSLSKVFS
jgi:type III secretory pathway component EscS